MSEPSANPSFLPHLWGAASLNPGALFLGQNDQGEGLRMMAQPVPLRESHFPVGVYCELCPSYPVRTLLQKKKIRDIIYV